AHPTDHLCLIFGNRLTNKPIPDKAQEQNPGEPRNESDVKIEFSKELLTELQNNTFSGRSEEDVIEHIGKVLEILDLVKIAGMDPFQLCMKAFPFSLSKDVKEWWINEGNGNISTWEELVKKIFKFFYPLSCASNYDKMYDDDEEGHDLLEFIPWRNSKFKIVDETTKRALLYTWIEIGKDEGLLNDEVQAMKNGKSMDTKTLLMTHSPNLILKFIKTKIMGTLTT
ncbi:hypothetical protein Tco_0661703, partial [Tanacetum coccineum]